MRFRPSLVPTLFVVVGLIVLLNLGFWQLRRNEAAKERVAAIKERVESPPLANADLSRPPDELHFRRAELTGRWTSAPPLLMTGRYEFGEVGFDVIQPFVVDGGPVLLVNRGWIARRDHDEALAAIATGDRPDALRGLLVQYEGGASAPLPADGDNPERWPPDSYAGMAAHLGGSFAPVVLVVGEPLAKGRQKDPNTFPVTGYRPEVKTRPHLEYATTWFLIAGTLVVVWAASSIERPGAGRKAGEASAAR